MEDANDNNNWLRKTTEGASKYGMEIYNVKKNKIVFFFMCDEQKAFRYFNSLSIFTLPRLHLNGRAMIWPGHV